MHICGSCTMLGANRHSVWKFPSAGSTSVTLDFPLELGMAFSRGHSTLGTTPNESPGPDAWHPERIEAAAGVTVPSDRGTVRPATEFCALRRRISAGSGGPPRPPVWGHHGLGTSTSTGRYRSPLPLVRWPVHTMISLRAGDCAWMSCSDAVVGASPSHTRVCGDAGIARIGNGQVWQDM